jgi:hypothetical protein
MPALGKTPTIRENPNLTGNRTPDAGAHSPLEDSKNSTPKNTRRINLSSYQLYSFRRYRACSGLGFSPMPALGKTPIIGENPN